METISHILIVYLIWILMNLIITLITLIKNRRDWDNSWMDMDDFLTLVWKNGTPYYILIVSLVEIFVNTFKKKW